MKGYHLAQKTKQKTADTSFKDTMKTYFCYCQTLL